MSPRLREPQNCRERRRRRRANAAATTADDCEVATAGRSARSAAGRLRQSSDGRRRTARDACCSALREHEEKKLYSSSSSRPTNRPSGRMKTRQRASRSCLASRARLLPRSRPSPSCFIAAAAPPSICAICRRLGASCASQRQNFGFAVLMSALICLFFNLKCLLFTCCLLF